MPAPTKKLTAKQLGVIQAASEGVTQAVMARREDVSESTIGTRVERAFKKLGAHSMPHAVALCILRGDIPGPLVCDGHE